MGTGTPQIEPVDNKIGSDAALFAHRHAADNNCRDPAIIRQRGNIFHESNDLSARPNHASQRVTLSAG